MFNEKAKEIFEGNKSREFWDQERNVGELLMLTVSELGEAMEAHRKGKFADVDEFKQLLTDYENALYPTLDNEPAFKSGFSHYIKDTFEDEIADAIIRLLDLGAGLGIDLDYHIEQKLKYNATRERLHGKLY